jgi:predicted nucleotidyltransferase
VGYAKLLSETFLSLYGQEIPDILSLPNNILAISYISALQKLNSTIRPHTILRHGSDEDGASEDVLAGATHVRSLFLSAQTEEALLHIPSELHPLWEDALSRGVAPVSYESFAPILLSHLRMKTETRTPIADAGGGVLSLLQNTARSACTMEELISLAATKKYTHAHLRRATLFSYFGVTPSMLRADALYTQVLAMDSRGMAILHHIRKSAGIAILTKPADLQKLSPPAREQAQMNYRADSIYSFAKPIADHADTFVRATPYRK